MFLKYDQKMLLKEVSQKISALHIIGMKKSMIHSWITGPQNDKPVQAYRSLILLEEVLHQKRTVIDFVLLIQILFLTGVSLSWMGKNIMPSIPAAR